MTPEEFKVWQKIWESAPLDADNESVFADAAWRALSAKIDRLEREPFDDAATWANAIVWAAFWLAIGAVGTLPGK